MKQLTAIFILCIVLAGKGFAQDTALARYQGNYRFPAGGQAGNAVVLVKGDKLEISAAIGTATLKRRKMDLFDVVEYEGSVQFLRDTAGKVARLQVKIPAGEIDLEGELHPEDVDSTETVTEEITTGMLSGDEMRQMMVELGPGPIQPARVREPFVAGGAFDVQAHQGGCGLYPCNTIEAFINAVKLGVNTLELDCVVSKDLRVVVSHDQFMNATMLLPSGSDAITKDNQLSYNIFTMKYDSVRKFDAGSRKNPEFPQQKKLKTYKPLLTEVIDSVENYVRRNKLKPVRYNIEIKSLRGDDQFHPSPEIFADLITRIVYGRRIEWQVLIQSFDVRPLKIIHERYPNLMISLLVHNQKTLEENLQALGFKPDVYSPHFSLVTPALVKEVKEKKIGLIPWTVDQLSDLKKIKAMGVDGIITNYPDRLLSLKK
ncbi:MAG: glycerophosphodiester phosphodiesterase family protein [Candidatus Pseudobacter hemicellulosilyticus]|uniref:Glycerophosphodiester phosphodiesterase family protein n=1 Tax=Candidatus Pseudobacter hemicellulosilyticus TaxID=3121375 RepID=A0AAJ5WY01_9BACT|nr:MAG: glycerophosphodiester phosphodiesterase family protein [Pseudobacter sp.]